MSLQSQPDSSNQATTIVGLSDPAQGLSTLGEFRLLRRIGEGGMSVVYLGYHAKSRRTFAVKVLNDQLAENPVLLERFTKEAKMSRELSHPNIVCGFSSGRDRTTGHYFLVMEYIDGPTAHQRLERDGRFSVGAATCVLLDIARALEYLHSRKFVHRDIKPDNILLAPDGSAKLADLGVIKHPSKSQDLTAWGDGIGTPYYMPWEQTISPDTVDARSDLFALGATYYHLLTGCLPFPGEDEAEITRLKTQGKYIPATELVPGLPLAVDTILARLLVWDPRKRFQSATELIEIVTASGLAERYTGPLPFEKGDAEVGSIAPTRADLKAAYVDTPIEGQREQIWILKYRRNVEQGWRKLRGTTQDIVRLLESGYLPDEVYAARAAGQQYRRIQAYPEFRNLVLQADTSSVKSDDPTTTTPKSLRPAPSDPERPRRFTCRRTVCFLSLIFVALGVSATAVIRIMTCH